MSLSLTLAKVSPFSTTKSAGAVSGPGARNCDCPQVMMPKSSTSATMSSVSAFAATWRIIARCLVHAPEHQRGVGAAEAERIGERHVDPLLDRLPRREVERGLDRGLVEVDRR